MTSAASNETLFAIVSDVHGNLPALEAVVEHIDGRGIRRVVHGGDLAVLGAQPGEVVDLIRELGWPGIVGNTDELLWRPEELEAQLAAAPKQAALLTLLFEVYGPATAQLLEEDRIEWLRELPTEHREADVAIVHASPGDLWRAPAPDADDEQLREVYGPLEAAIAVYGHIHRPFVRELESLTVVNSGSVGSPFDRDPRASYVVIESGGAEIVRVEYDLERELYAVMRSGYPDAERIAQMRRTGTFVPVA
jgi:putative phosphoesterase